MRSKQKFVSIGCDQRLYFSNIDDKEGSICKRFHRTTTTLQQPTLGNYGVFPFFVFESDDEQSASVSIDLDEMILTIIVSMFESGCHSTKEQV